MSIKFRQLYGMHTQCVTSPITSTQLSGRYLGLFPNFYSAGGQVRTNNGINIEGGCDEQRVDCYYISEQYCSVCAQMVPPRWIPAYAQDTTVLLHHQEREEEEKEENSQEGEREEGVCTWCDECAFLNWCVYVWVCWGEGRGG